jgi:hypothetical protein
LLGGYPPGFHRVDQGLIVTLVLVGVSGGEPRDGLVEDVRAAQVGRDGDPVAGPRVRPGQRPAAQRAVHLQPFRAKQGDLDGEFPVPQLPDVEVPGPPVQACLGALPAQEDVGRRLHQPLAGDHSLALVGILAGADEPAEHRRLCLLDLQEQRISFVPAEHQDDPAAGADAADPDDLAGYVAQLELLEQVPAVGRQRALILAEQALQLRFEGGTVGLRRDELVGGNQERRFGDDPRAAIDHPGQLGQFLHAVPGPRLGQALVQELSLPRPELGVELRPQLGDVGARVPDVQVGHAGELAHGLPVAVDGGQDDLTALPGREAVIPPGHLQAGREPLDIPLPRAGQRLVEVVDVEHQAPFGRAEQAEVG